MFRPRPTPSVKVSFTIELTAEKYMRFIKLGYEYGYTPDPKLPRHSNERHAVIHGITKAIIFEDFLKRQK